MSHNKVVKVREYANGGGAGLRVTGEKRRQVRIDRLAKLNKRERDSKKLERFVMRFETDWRG